jgi:hypothetical protein
MRRFPFRFGVYRADDPRPLRAFADAAGASSERDSADYQSVVSYGHRRASF